MAWRSHGRTNIEMVRNLRSNGIIKSDIVEAAMLAVDRSHYSKNNPFMDAPQSIGFGVTISAPHMHAHALELLKDQLVTGTRALDVGSGSGYLTACMAKIMGAKGIAVGIDHIPELVEMSKQNVQSENSDLLSSGQVQLITGDGRKGYEDLAPYDAIHVGAAAPTLPQALIDQLKLNLSNFFLDEEWNYTHKLQNNSNLPFFIKRFYEQRLKHPNKTNAVRILFNINSNTTSSIIKFNLDSLKPKENVSDADLYFYWPLENSSSIYKTSVVLRLYQFEKQFNNALNESNLVENPDVHKLFNVIYISKAQKGWQTFKIKKPIDNWAKGEDNLGLLLTISSYDDNKLVSVFNDTNQGIFRTFAVLNVHKNETFIHTTTNSTNHTTPSTDSTSHNSTILTQNCSIKPWQVDFRHLQWDKFIVYPELGFMAYQCAGKCHLDDPDQVNHVKLRMLNGLIGAKERSCCVATEFLKLPIMYYDKVGNVVLKTYDDMVVKECGCR